MANLNIQRNARVMAADGEVGRVTHVVVDPQTKEVTDLVVEGNGGEQLVPVTAVQSMDGDRVLLQGSRAQFRGRAFDREYYHEVDDDEVREETTRTAQRGGAPLVDADEDEVEVAAGQPAARAARREAQSEQPGRLQLREERLRVEKVQEEAGEVRLGTRVVEREETVTVPLREERVVIERRAGSGEVVSDDLDARRGETIEVDVMRERVNVEKEAVVAEEVDVRKEVTERQERVSETVRREELVVEGDAGLLSRGETTDDDASRQQRRR